MNLYEYDKVTRSTTRGIGSVLQVSHEPGIKSYCVAAVRVCPQCGEEYKRFKGEIDYIQKLGNEDVILCSYNCKAKFIQKHKEQIEKEKIDKFERAYEKIKANKKKCCKKAKEQKTK